MKKNFIYFLLLCSLIAQAQITPSYPTIKLTKTVEGVKQDSLLVVGTDKTVKHIPYSKISNVHEYATASALPVTGVAGKLYITKDNNKIYTWNGTFYSEFFGAKGEKGDQGPQGIQGVAGLTGLKGDKGDVGLTGSIGLTGAKGDKGDIGLTGVAGTNGLDGAKGDQGIQGIQGFKGDTGLTGADGAMGVQGPQGIQGIQGETGLRGIQGETGPQGPIGFTGEKGADGTGVSIKGSFDNTSQLPASGADGDAYLINGNLHVWNGTAWVNVGNIQGPQGLIGLTGATGSQGIQGVKGDKGDQGPQGIQGLKGDTGAKGDTGSFNGDLTADQVTETATRKFQTPTQSAYNDATSSIQGQLNSKENAFTKNTAFNKNFGTASGTVAEGNDSRINNGHTAFSWGNHLGKYYNRVNSTSILDCNLQEDGIITGFRWTNAPVSTIASLKTVVYSPDWIDQTFTSIGATTSSWVRTRYGGSTWSPWSVVWTENNFSPDGKVDKVAGKSLIADTEIARLSTVTNQDISGKENTFSKNTAFNKNFGTTAGTVIEGGTLGSNAYTSTAYQPLLTNPITGTGTTSYISKWTGAGTQGSSGMSNTVNDFFIGNSGGLFLNGNGLYGSGILSDALGTTLKLQSGGVTQVTLSPTGVATFASSVTAPTFNGSATLTGTPTAPTAALGTNTTQIATTAFVAGGLATKENTFSKNTAFNKNFGTTSGTVVEGGTLGSNAYTSTVIPTNTNQLTNGSGYITDISGKVDKVAGKSLISDSEITRLATVTNQDISGKFDKTGGAISGNVNVTGTVTASGGFFNSDRRLKHIFKRDGDVAYYTWKDGRDNKTHIGYIAQEVQKTHPDQVQSDDKGILSVNYVEILVEKIRVLEKRIEQLEKSK